MRWSRSEGRNQEGYHWGEYDVTADNFAKVVNFKKIVETLSEFASERTWFARQHGLPNADDYTAMVAEFDAQIMNNAKRRYYTKADTAGVSTASKGGNPKWSHTDLVLIAWVRSPHLAQRLAPKPSSLFFIQDNTGIGRSRILSDIYYLLLKMQLDGYQEIPLLQLVTAPWLQSTSNVTVLSLRQHS